MGRAASRAEDDTATLDELGRDFPGWQPWRSSAGRWWAVRRAAAPPPDAPEQWARTVDGDPPEELRAALAGQEALAGHVRR